MKQKQMSWLMFKIMAFTMSVFKIFRNIDKEIYFTGIKSGCIVLDFGCGLGFNTILASKIVGHEGKIFALDNHKKAIEIIKRKIKKYKLKNIETILSDCNTGLGDNTIDAVFLHNTFPMIKNKKRVLNEIHRVLKIKGKLSYISRAGSRLMVKNKMTNKGLTDNLKKEYKMELIKQNDEHLLFQKTEK